MAWNPSAVRLELQPESRDQPTIKPTQFIIHSVVAPWDEHRIYAYWRDSTNLESHFGLDFDGSLGQYLSTTTRADANAGANRRSDGTGAVSLESASNTAASDAWTDKQLAELAELAVWLHRTHPAIALRGCRTATDPGIGYHSQYRAWSTTGTACPGTKRIAQFKSELLPEIIRLGGVKPPPPPATTKPKVSLAHIVAAQRRDPGLPQGGTTHKAEGLVVENALYKANLLAKGYVDGSLGTRTKPAVSEWQERLGYRGRQPGGDADGTFGLNSLKQLGLKYGFTVTA